MPTAIIRTAYAIITPESAEQGDYAEQGWLDEDGTEYTFREAVKLLRGLYDWGFCPSSSRFHLGVWYLTYPETDFCTGAETSKSYFVDASERFQRRLFAVVTGKKVRT